MYRRATSSLPIWIAHACALILVAALMRTGLAPRLVFAELIPDARAEMRPRAFTAWLGGSFVGMSLLQFALLAR